jgi:small subunit ribosomal protein S9
MTTISPIQMPGTEPPASTRPVKVAKPADKRGWWWGTGRRKTAVARIRMKPGNGSFMIEAPNGKKKTPEQYFAEERDRNDCFAAFKATGLEGKFDVVAKCHGGGFMGQAGAVRMAIARALRDYDPSTETALRAAGFLTRDSREVERKKYGQAGARRRFQFSKR